MAALVYLDVRSHARRTCGVTILSEKKLMTSAHCVYHRHSITLMFATINTDEPYHEVSISDEEIIIHPEYNESNHSNNIAIIELESPLEFSRKIGKIDMIEEASWERIKTDIDVQILEYKQSVDPDRIYTDTHLRVKGRKIEKCSGADNSVNERLWCLKAVEAEKDQQYSGGNRSPLKNPN